MSPQVICLGECLIDRIFHRYDAHQPDAACWHDYPGGAPANVATGLAKLGNSSGFLGCIGQDSAGEQILSTLTASGIDCSHVQIHPAAPTRVVLVHRDARGDRHFVGFSQSQIDGYADTLMQPDPLPDHWFDTASFLVMGTLGLAYATTRNSMKKALEWSKRKGMTTVVDVNWRPPFWPETHLAPGQIKAFINQADIVKLSQEEAHWLFQTSDARQILKQLDRPQVVLMTAGAAGCWYATASINGTIPAFPVECEDTTGAGDAFLAGFIHKLCQAGLESLDDAHLLQQGIRYACAAGALTTLRPGAMAAQPRAEEVDAFLYLKLS